MGAKEVFRDLFFKGSPMSEKLVTDDDLRGGYKSRPSICSKLPWLDIVGDDNAVLLEDAKSVAGVMELKPISIEARSLEYIVGRRDALQRILSESFPEYRHSPWTVQIYAFPDAAGFRDLPDYLMDYALDRHQKRDADLAPFTHWFIDKVWRPHIEDMAAEEGLFLEGDEDDGKPWGGNYRRVYMVFYRRHTSSSKMKKGQTPETELDAICQKLSTTLRSGNVRSRRLQGEEIRNWLFRWFNPNPKATGGDTEALLKSSPYSLSAQDEMELPVGFTLADDVMTRDCRSDKETQNWYFDGMAHTVLTVEQLRQRPEIGQLTAERTVAGTEGSSQAETLCLVDDLPAGATLILTFVIHPQSEWKKHLEVMEKRSKSQNQESADSREAIAHARQQMIRNNKLYPFTLAVALRAEDDYELEQQIEQVDSVLSSNNLQIVDPENDPYRLDSYLRHLPMGYDERLDQVKNRSRFIYAQHLANLAPLYGRETGTGKPLLVFFNRGGEPFTVDPLHLLDRSKNAHLFLFGPTGAGKSATLVYLQMLITAIYNPRWVVIEAGNSFGLLTQVFEKYQQSVVNIDLRPGKAPSLAPYQPMMEIIDDEGEVIKNKALESDSDGVESEQDSDADGEESQRDILKEMALIAKLMVTGGEAEEEARFSRADKGLLQEALISAAKKVRLNGDTHIITENVLAELIELKSSRPDRSSRIQEMADAMRLFCDGFAGELFNRPGDSLPDADYIRVDMGALALDANDQLSVAYITIINQVVDRAQRTQRDGRDTICLTDECHLITTNPLLAQYMVILAKLLGRRMAVWLWMATQNMEDFKDDAKKMMSMFEWWICLFVGKDELEHIERFKQLSDDDKVLLTSTRKVQHKYTEGVVLADTMQGLFRNTPPLPCLTLAGSEKEEKTARQKVMDKRGCGEVQAAMYIADDIRAARKKSLRIARGEIV